MGLIKAAVNAAKSTLKDQWLDYIKCENMDNDTLMVRKSTDNGVISKKSAIQVGPGQIAVIFDSGKILDATAEEGVYTFDSSTSPSFFGGDFGGVFKEMWTRFKYNGGTSKEQAVFFINAKEIIDNKFGTPAPVPFQDYSHPIPNQMTNTLTPLRVEVKCFGKYTFKINDPAIFMREIAGTAEVYTKKDICEQMRSEVQASFQKVLNELGNSEHKAPVLELPSKTDEIKEIMDEKVFDQKIRERGMKVTGFLIESVTLDDESNKKIDSYEVSSNAYMQQGKMLDVMDNAAKNANGAATGMMGVGMMNMMGGNSNIGIPNAASSMHSEEGTKCPNCGTIAKGKFCQECGTKIEKGPKKCSNCGTEVTGKFCPECGTKVE